MLWNYLILATRNLRRHRFNAILNVLGLSIGLACLLIALIYTDYQFSYNRQHAKLDRTYRVIHEVNDALGTHYRHLTPPMARHLEAEIPEIEHAVQIFNRSMWVHTDVRGFRVRTCVASPNILDTFTYPLVKGEPSNLRRSGTAFITQSLAQRLFGKEEPIGQRVSVNHKWVHGEFEITGILADIPGNNDPKLRFEFLTSTFPDGPRRDALWEDWAGAGGLLSTHILVREGADIDLLSEKIRVIAARRELARSYEGYDYHLQPGLRMHLFTTQDYGGQSDGPSGKISTVTNLLTIGFLVLGLACLNYVNLVTSQSSERSREVGLRKVSGASRKQLTWQFLGESVLLSGVAFIVALSLAHYALPYVGDLLESPLRLDAVDPLVLACLPMVLVPMVGLLAGLYPALVLSRQQPITALSGDTRASAGSLLRRILVLLQFSASTCLIILTIVIYNQVTYIQNKDLGFHRDSVVVLPMFRDTQLWNQQTAIRTQIENIPGVVSASVSHHLPGEVTDVQNMTAAGNAEATLGFQFTGIDENFLSTFGVDLLHGRNITQNDLGTGEANVLINETGAQAIGWSPGSTTVLRNERGNQLRVVGVVRDYHNQSLHGGIMPMLLYPVNSPRVVYVRIASSDLTQTMGAIESVWRKFLPSRPLDYEFLNDRLDALYRTERTRRKILTIFSALAIIVSCLGTLGLVTYTARTRRKEMGVRKVLGAGNRVVAYLLSRELISLVVVASAVATPVAYILCRDWLNTFAYRIDLSVSAFLAGGAVTLGLVSLSAVAQTIRTARENPVDALREG